MKSDTKARAFPQVTLDYSRFKECVTKSMLRSDRLKNYFTKINSANRKTWQVINELTSSKTVGQVLGLGVESEWCFSN